MTARAIAHNRGGMVVIECTPEVARDMAYAYAEAQTQPSPTGTPVWVTHVVEILTAACFAQMDGAEGDFVLTPIRGGGV